MRTIVYQCDTRLHLRQPVQDRDRAEDRRPLAYPFVPLQVGQDRQGG